jgi:hypothetical protein
MMTIADQILMMSGDGNSTCAVGLLPWGTALSATKDAEFQHHCSAININGISSC